jgi:hypothetical protein
MSMSLGKKSMQMELDSKSINDLLDERKPRHLHNGIVVDSEYRRLNGKLQEPNLKM